MFELPKNRLNAGKIAVAVLVIGMALLSLPPSVRCARPLITDDAGTMGKGRLQVELSLDVSDQRQDEDGVVTKEDHVSAATAFYYGIVDNVDIVLGLPFEKTKIRVDDETVYDKGGFTDVSLGLKWRFFEKNGYAMAMKPGVTLPTGNDAKGLGAWKVTCGILFIATKELGHFAFHFNAGYRRNENRTDERKDIWGADLALEVKAMKDLMLVCNVGIATNTDRRSSADPAFALGGITYNITESFDIDLGCKRGLNEAEADNTYIGGLTIKF